MSPEAIKRCLKFKRKQFTIRFLDEVVAEYFSIISVTGSTHVAIEFIFGLSFMASGNGGSSFVAEMTHELEKSQ